MKNLNDIKPHPGAAEAIRVAEERSKQVTVQYEERVDGMLDATIKTIDTFSTSMRLRMLGEFTLDALKQYRHAPYAIEGLYRAWRHYAPDNFYKPHPEAHPFEHLMSRSENAAMYWALNAHRHRDADVTKELKKALIVRGNSASPEVRAMVSFDYYGRESFQLPESLWQAFNRTDIEGRELAEFGFPYPMFYIELLGHPVWRGFFFSAHENVPGGGERRPFFFDDKEVELEPLDNHYQILAVAPDNSIVELLKMQGMSTDSGDSYWKLHVSEPGFYENDEAEARDIASDELFHIAHNLALYLSDPTVELERTGPSLSERRRGEEELFKRFRRKNRQQSKRPIQKIPATRLTTIKFRTGERSAPQQHEDSDRQSPVVHWVRGHWKAIWKKIEGEQQRVAKWIRPYVRGGTPKVSMMYEATTYDVKAPETEHPGAS